MRHPYQEVPIVATATPPGKGAIAIIRLSGAGVIGLVNQVFYGKDLTKQASHTVHFGTIQSGDTLLDEVLVTLFQGPKSFTREDTVEISCHGSNFIIQQITQCLIQKGARLANPGEFTMRAFLNGRLDLTQAEGVADLIAAESSVAHRTALAQMRGGFSTKLKRLRKEMVHLASLLALELDFSEEDVIFADREMLYKLTISLLNSVNHLMQGFALGNVIKHGITTVIAGAPNVGKSTLLNALINEEKAIVSNTPGTTRDLIEVTLNIEGIQFRLIDTAGLREYTADPIESIGITKTTEKLRNAALIIYLFDLEKATLPQLTEASTVLNTWAAPHIKVGNKVDVASPELLDKLKQEGFLFISAKQGKNLSLLKAQMVTHGYKNKMPTQNMIAVNTRHYSSLSKSKKALESLLQGLANKITHELLAQEIHSALQYLGEITGEVTTDELLHNLFANFCIGK